LEPLVERLSLSRRYVDNIRRIVAALPRLVSGRPGRLTRTDVFDATVEVAFANLVARREPTDALEKYRVAPRPQQHQQQHAPRHFDAPPAPRRGQQRRRSP
jgi:poly(A) polymerase